MSSMSRTFLEANTSDNFLSIDIDVHKPALNKALRVESSSIGENLITV